MVPAPPTTKKKLPWWAGLLILFGVLALLGVLGVGAVVWWFSANKDRIASEAQQTHAEAMQFAAGHDQNACVNEGLRRIEACSGVMCEAQVQIFTATCIEQAAAAPGFCDGVPKPDEIIKTSRWAVTECSRRGKAGSQRCTRLVQVLPKTCQRLP